MSNLVMARSSETIQVAAGQSVTAYTQDTATLIQTIAGSSSTLGTVSQQQITFGPFSAAAAVTITSGNNSTIYSVGSTPAVSELVASRIQRTPGAMNSAGAISFSMMAGGLVTSASTLGITCTLPVGAVLDTMRDFKVDDAFDWSVVVIGLFGFTVGASAGHTVVGNATVASATSGMFRTRKTGANTFVTYRLA